MALDNFARPSHARVNRRAVARKQASIDVSVAVTSDKQPLHEGNRGQIRSYRVVFGPITSTTRILVGSTSTTLSCSSVYPKDSAVWFSATT